MSAGESIVRMVKGILVIAGFFAVLGGGIALYSAIQEWRSNSIKSKFSHLDQFLDEYVQIVKKRNKSDTPMVVPLKGKPVVICMNKNDNYTAGRSNTSFDPVMLDLPRSLFPENDSVISVIVGLYWSENDLTKFDGGAVGCQETCDVYLVDRASRSIISQKQIVGGPAPRRISKISAESGGRVYGAGCDQAVADYITSVFSK